MSYRDGQLVYVDEQEAYERFLSTASRETWGTMTLAEWRNRPNNQMVHWDMWVAQNRPKPIQKPTIE